MSRRSPKCVECGGLFGGHMTGCPEDYDRDEPKQEKAACCRCCGMDALCIIEKAGPICLTCAPEK